MERWCVVGGGMLGLDLGRRLAAAGHAVSVWESAPRPGGLAAPWQIGDVEWDRFYHVIAGADAELLELLRILDVECEVNWVKAQTGFYTGGRLHPFSSVLDFARFPALNPFEKLRLASTILYASRVEDWQALEDLTAVDWLTRLSGRSVVERIWLPLLRAKLGDNAQRVSAAFIWTIIKRMYGARSSAGKSECFGYVPGGYARILERLLAYLAERGVDVETGVGVERVVPAAGERVRVERTDGTGETFDAVAVTVPAAVAAGICGELSPSERDRLSGIDYQGVVCASLLLRRPLSPYYITNITDPAPFTAVIEMDALTGTQPFGGHALVYLPKYVASSDPAFGKPDREIAAEFLEALRRMHPSLSDGDLVALRVAKARYVLPLSTLHYSERTPPFTTSIPNLYLANSTQIVNGTLNVNQTLTLGKAAADAIERDRASRPARRVEACA